MDTQMKTGASPRQSWQARGWTTGLKRTGLAALLACAFGGAHAGPGAFSGNVVKIGILNDQSGLYADLAGLGSVEAARMAIEEMGGTVAGKRSSWCPATTRIKPTSAR